jgi:hypothetical protein
MAPAAEDAGSPSTLYRYRLSHPRTEWFELDTHRCCGSGFSYSQLILMDRIRLAAYHCSDLRYRFDCEFSIKMSLSSVDKMKTVIFDA